MPGPVVVSEALIMCVAGDVPRGLRATSQELARINGRAIATIMDFVPELNVPSFGMCALLTAEAMGVPCPCVPLTTSPWLPGSEIRRIDGQPILTMPAELQCDIGGVITVIDPGQEEDICT